MTGRKRWIKLKFILKIEEVDFKKLPNYESKEKIGELHLIYDENLEFLDENWQIDINYLGAITSSIP